MPIKFNPLLKGGFDETKRIINDLEDVNTAGTVNGDVLTFQSGTWIPQTAAGGGDMTRAVYDVNDNDIVDNSERLEGNTLATVQAHGVDAGTITQGTIGLARVPTMDDAHIPNLETLSYSVAFAAGQIPNLPTTKITSGTFNANRIPSLPNLKGTVTDAKIPDLETLSYGGAFAEGQIPNLPTTKITSGTFGLARIPSIDNAHLAGGITSDKIPALDGTAITYPLNADSVGTTQIESGGVANDELAASGLDIAKFTIGTAGVDRIPSLPAGRITTGTFGLARIPVMDDAHIPDLETLSYGAAFGTAQVPSLGAYKIASGTLNADRIPNLPTVKITSGTFNSDRIPILPTNRYGSAVLVSGTRAMTGDLDFAKHQAKAMALEALGSAPASPATAQMYYNTGDDKVYVYVA